MDESVLEEKPSFKILVLILSCKLDDWGPFIIFIAKTVPKKLEPCFFLRSFFLLRLLFISTIQLCMEYCCHVWTGTPSCYLDMLDKLLKWVCKTVCPSLSTPVEPSAHCGNVASFFYRMSIWTSYTGFTFLSHDRSTCYSNRLHLFYCHYS